MQEEVISRKIKKSLDFDCSICLSEVEVPVVTQCGHLFCWGCLYGWGCKSNICPVCKTMCSLSTVIPIYSKGASTAERPIPKLPVPVSAYSMHASQMAEIQYNERLRFLHMEGVEYRRSIQSKQYLLVKAFYAAALIFCLGLFVLME